MIGSRPSVQPKPGEICRCGRPRNTAADLERWRAEFPDGPQAPEPEWARSICWSTRPIDQCNMKHVTTMEPKR